MALLPALFLALGFCPLAAAGGGTPPPAWKNPTCVSFNDTFSDYAVLQQAPAKSAVYGLAPAGASLTITVAGAAGAAYSVKATASARGGWKAYLKPADDKNVTVTAHCASGCTNSTDAVLAHVTFGVSSIALALPVQEGPSFAHPRICCRTSGIAVAKVICGCRWDSATPATTPRPTLPAESFRTSG